MRPLDMEGFRHAAEELRNAGHTLEAAYIDDAAAEIDRLRALMTEAVEDLQTRAQLAVDSGDEKEVVLCISDGILQRMREAVGSKDAGQ